MFATWMATLPTRFFTSIAVLTNLISYIYIYILYRNAQTIDKTNLLCDKVVDRCDYHTSACDHIFFHMNNPQPQNKATFELRVHHDKPLGPTVCKEDMA